MNVYLAVLLLVLETLDVLTTIRFLRAGRSEGNPIALAMFDRIGFWGTVAAKAVPALALAYLGYLYPHNGLVTLLLAAGCVGLAFVVIGNLDTKDRA